MGAAADSSALGARPYDEVIQQIAEYAKKGAGPPSGEAIETARHCLMDSIGCALLALQYPACAKLLGPSVPGATLDHGTRVVGTGWRLDPAQGAFNLGTMIRWLDYNDTWLAAEWGHPSDNFGAILAVADCLDRNAHTPWYRQSEWRMEQVLEYAIRAYEIQGVLALTNSFNRVGLDHVLLVRIASTAVACAMFGGDVPEIAAAVSHAWLDGGALRTYRHAPNTGSRKSWAAGDATRRAVQLSLWARTGEMGYPSALTAPHWGFHDVLMRGKGIELSQPLASYVMENILFKVSFPAEFHAQTAAEAALQLHRDVVDRWKEIDSITIHTQESAVRIIDKTGPLRNPADRDHCIQYIVAAALLFGDLKAEHYEDAVAADPRIDALRQKMKVIEDRKYTTDYLARDLRSIGNRVQVHFADGSSTRAVEVEFPIGHRRRRTEAVPLIKEKFVANALEHLPPETVDQALEIWNQTERFHTMRVRDWMDLWVVPECLPGAWAESFPRASGQE